jgi:hypothetical protein
MGEQMLSREYYYLGTQLPIDRFLTFYYGHPGFHIHNMLVILSVQTFVVTSEFYSFRSLLLVTDPFIQWYSWALSIRNSGFASTLRLAR